MRFVTIRRGRFAGRYVRELAIRTVPGDTQVQVEIDGVALWLSDRDVQR